MLRYFAVTAAHSLVLSCAICAIMLYWLLLWQGKSAWSSLPVSMPAAGAAAVVQCCECAAAPAVAFCEQCNGAALCSQCDTAVHKAGTIYT
jgi:hypothetical protein